MPPDMKKAPLGAFFVCELTLFLVCKPTLHKGLPFHSAKQLVVDQVAEAVHCQ